MQFHWHIQSNGALDSFTRIIIRFGGNITVSVVILKLMTMWQILQADLQAFCWRVWLWQTQRFTTNSLVATKPWAIRRNYWSIGNISQIDLYVCWSNNCLDLRNLLKTLQLESSAFFANCFVKSWPKKGLQCSFLKGDTERA